MKRLLLALSLLTFATVADAATVSTIAVASGTVTVTTSAAHGLAVNQGVCLSAPANVCTAVATVPSGTQITFAQPSNVTVAACASSCGTAVAAPRIIVLDVQQPNQATQVFHYLLWLTTTTPLARSGATSAWTAGSGSAGPTTAQNTALAAGNFIEVNLAQSFPSSMAVTDVENYLQQDYATRQSALAANTQPGVYFGFYWDGTQWIRQ